MGSYVEDLDRGSRRRRVEKVRNSEFSLEVCSVDGSLGLPSGASLYKLGAWV